MQNKNRHYEIFVLLNVSIRLDLDYPESNMTFKKQGFQKEKGILKLIKHGNKIEIKWIRKTPKIALLIRWLIGSSTYPKDRVKYSRIFKGTPKVMWDILQVY